MLFFFKNFNFFLHHYEDGTTERVKYSSKKPSTFLTAENTFWNLEKNKKGMVNTSELEKDKKQDNITKETKKK